MDAIDTPTETRADWFRRLMADSHIGSLESNSIISQYCEDFVLDDELNHEQRIELALAYLQKVYRERE
jgi:hypothetical protein